MRGSISLVCLSAFLLTAPLLAQKEPGNKDFIPEPKNTPQPLNDVDNGIARGGGFYMEDFESFSVGPLVPQGGWDSEWANNVEVVSGGINGSQSARHASDGTAFSGFEIISPVFDRDFHTFAQDVVITGGSSTYQVCPADFAQGSLVTRITFEPSGDITVGQFNVGTDLFDFIDSGVNWSPGVSVSVQVNTYPDGTFEVFLDGSSVHTGDETNFLVNGTPGQIDSIFYWAGNEGTGDFDGTGDTMTVDNLTTNPVTIPTLGEWGMIAFVLVLMASGVFFLRRGRVS